MFELITTALIFSILIGLGLMFFRSSWSQVMMYPAIILLAYVALFEMPGVGKSTEWEWRDMDHANVIHYVFEEEKAIHLWLYLPGNSTPRYYTRPWSEQEAEQLYGSMIYRDEMFDKGLNMIVMFNQGGDFDETPMYYASPRKPDPRKDLPLVEHIIVE